MSDAFVKRFASGNKLPKGSPDPGPSASDGVVAAGVAAAVGTATSGAYSPWVIGGVLIIGAVIVYFLYKWLMAPAPGAQPAPAPPAAEN
jgi:hypothetical protein